MDAPPHDARSAFPPSTTLALTSLVLGIAAIGLSFIVVGFIVGLAGIGFGIAHLSRKRGPTGMARWGVGLSIFGMILSLGFCGLYYYYFQQLKNGGFAKAFMAGGGLTNVTVIPPSSAPLKSNIVWTASVPGGQALCAGDWENDGGARVLVAAGTTLHVLDLTGREKSTVALPDRFTSIECGRDKKAGTRLLGYTQWGQRIDVIDHSGNVAWNYATVAGVDGAHWGDLDGDGNDEIIVGMNGGGGLVALSGGGKKIWGAALNNVWGQAVVSATPGHRALVVATDVRGSINIFDASGASTAFLKPSAGYYTGVGACATDAKSVQILAFAPNAAVAINAPTNVAWMCAATGDAFNARPCCAFGDFKGDGAREWVFLDGAGDLVVATPDGKKLAWIPAQGTIESFATAPQAGKGALLLTLDSGKVTAWSFSP